MNLLVVSSKPCLRSDRSPSGYAADGGFPFQMEFLSQLFDSTLLLVPVSESERDNGELPLVGRNLKISALESPAGRGVRRKLHLLGWLFRNGGKLIRAVHRADAVHAPIPGDIGTFGMLIAFVLQKPLFVRYCGNWTVRRTLAERAWQWFMVKFAGGRNVMFATGGMPEPPSPENPHLGWIFSTSLREEELTSLRQRPMQKSGVHLITVSRQEMGKGTDVLIRSLPLVRQWLPDISLDVVGGGSALPHFKRLARELQLEDCVRFHGHVDHQSVLELLKSATLFCYPTKSEGFPKVVLEALACGLPVITTKVSVLQHLVSSECGALLEEASPEAVANAVKGCMTDRARYAEMSASSYRIAEKYSLERWRDTIGAQLRMNWGPLRSNV
jgi:glycosyltransferase involved in cell wall biosynthesis